MPMPLDYRHASRDFDAFLAHAQDALALTTANQAYTTVQAVLIVFRRRLTPDQAIAFAGALPAVLRAIFVADWDIGAPPEPMCSMDDLIAEVQSVRRAHNFSPDNAIQVVAATLLHHIDRTAFDRVLNELPDDIAAFWSNPSGRR